MGKVQKVAKTIKNNVKTSKASYNSNDFSPDLKVILVKHGKNLTSRRTNNTTAKELKLYGSIISNSSELSNAFNNWAPPCQMIIIIMI